MTYKGKEIKSVTLEIVEDYIENKYKPTEIGTIKKRKV